MTSPSAVWIIRLILSALITALVLGACWYVWTELPQWIRKIRFLRGSLLQDLRFVVPLLAIYLMLSVVHPVLVRIWTRLLGNKDQPE